MTRKQILDGLLNLITDNKVELCERIAPERTNHLAVVLENIYQPHNASAALRSCDCFGVQNLHVIEEKNEYNPSRHVAMGAQKWINLHQHATTKECLTSLKEKGYRIVATTPHENDVFIDDFDLTEPFALVFGTEKKGLTQEALDMADSFVKIPMYGFTESFNISVSVALSLSKIRDRLTASDIPWRMTEEEQIELKIEWCKRILDRSDNVEDYILKSLN